MVVVWYSGNVGGWIRLDVFLIGVALLFLHRRLSLSCRSISWLDTGGTWNGDVAAFFSLLSLSFFLSYIIPLSYKP